MRRRMSLRGLAAVGVAAAMFMGFGGVAGQASADETTLTLLDPAGSPGPDGWSVVLFDVNPADVGGDFGPEQPVPYDAIWDDGSAEHNLLEEPALCARSDCFAGPFPPWPGYDDATQRWILEKEFEASEDGTATLEAIGFYADGAGRVRVNGVDSGLFSQFDDLDGISGESGGVPVSAGTNVIEIEVRDSHGMNLVTGRLDINLADAAEPPPAPACPEDGLQLLGGRGNRQLVSSTVHWLVEPLLGQVVDPITVDLLGLSTEELVHEVNCEVVEPVEDVVDDVYFSILDEPVVNILRGLGRGLGL